MKATRSKLSPADQTETTETLAADWWRLVAGCVVLAAVHSFGTYGALWVSNHWNTATGSVLPRLLIVLSVTAGTALVFRTCFSAVWMTLIRGELGRHQRGETWSTESLPAVSLFPALALSCAGIPCISATAALYLVAVVMLMTAMNSAETLKQHVLRYSPGFGDTRHTEGHGRGTFQLMIGVLTAALVPQIGEPMTSLQHSVLDAGLWGCVVISETVANEQSMIPAVLVVTCLVVSAVALALAALCIIGLPLLVNVLVHAHLCGLQGHRFSVLRELTVVTTLYAVCLTLVGPAVLRYEAALLALAGIATMRITHTESRVSQYLQRMRQLR